MAALAIVFLPLDFVHTALWFSSFFPFLIFLVCSFSPPTPPPLYHQLHCLPEGPWAKEQHQAYYAARLGSNRSHNHHSLNYTIEGESSENIQCHEVCSRLQCAHVAWTTDQSRFPFCQKSASAAQPAIRLVHLGAFRSSYLLSVYVCAGGDASWFVKKRLFMFWLWLDSDLLGFALASVCLCNLLALRREISIQNVVLYFLAVIWSLQLVAFLTVREVQSEGGAQPKFNLAPPAVAPGLGIVVTKGIKPKFYVASALGSALYDREQWTR